MYNDVRVYILCFAFFTLFDLVQYCTRYHWLLNRKILV